MASTGHWGNMSIKNVGETFGHQYPPSAKGHSRRLSKKATIYTTFGPDAF